MINQFRSQALAAWGEIHPHKAKPSTLDYLIQSRDYIIVFWFERGSKSGEPVLISKIPRTQNFNRYAERSVNLVDRLLVDLKPPVRETLPTRVIAGQVNDLTHIVMGIMPGEPITMPGEDSQGRRAVEQHLSAFLDWLVAFQSQAAVGSKVFDWDEFIQGQQELLGLDFLQADPYQETSRQLLRHLPTNSIPFTWGYGDAHHSNILLEGGRVSGVIDWIGVEEEQWSYTDWFYFLFFYALEFFKKNSKSDLDSQRRLAISTTMGVSDHWLTGIFQDKTTEFLEHISFDPKISPELLLTFLYDLHWPQGKAQLLKDAYSIYSQKII